MLRIGDVGIDRVVEWSGPLRPVEELLPDVPVSLWRDTGALPLHLVEPGARWRAAMQVWVVRMPGLLVLVDTGVGDGRDRPQAPAFDHLDTGFLQRLAATGVDPAAVDVVVNTHVHCDHVGWNTRAMDGRFVPAFPNARYLVPAADVEAFRPGGAGTGRAPKDEDERRRLEGLALVFEDSIRPIEESGQLEPWRGALEAAPGLRLEEAAGHTPGHSVAWVDGGDGAGAVFTGDLLHAPVQLLRPGAVCAFDLDGAAAAVSRRRVLARAAEERRWVVPAHVAGPGAFRVAVDGEHFRLARWAPLPSV